MRVKNDYMTRHETRAKLKLLSMPSRRRQRRTVDDTMIDQYEDNPNKALLAINSTTNKEATTGFTCNNFHYFELQLITSIIIRPS